MSLVLKLLQHAHRALLLKVLYQIVSLLLVDACELLEPGFELPWIIARFRRVDLMKTDLWLLFEVPLIVRAVADQLSDLVADALNRKRCGVQLVVPLGLLRLISFIEAVAHKDARVGHSVKRFKLLDHCDSRLCLLHNIVC